MVIKQTHTDNGYVVSTIFRNSILLAMDSAMSTLMDLFGVKPEDIDQPDLREPGDYETMVFYAEDFDSEEAGMPGLEFHRYNTEEEALAGHEELVQKWSEKGSGNG